MRRFIAFLFLVFCLTIPSLSESGELQVIGQSTDFLGSTATVATVQLGRDHYLAVGVSNPGEKGDATHILLKNEIDRFLKMGDKASKNKEKLKKGQFKILDSFAGGDDGLAFVRANVDGMSFTALQVTEDGRERGYILTVKSWASLRTQVKKGQKAL